MLAYCGNLLALKVFFAPNGNYNAVVCFNFLHGVADSFWFSCTARCIKIKFCIFSINFRSGSDFFLSWLCSLFNQIRNKKACIIQRHFLISYKRNSGLFYLGHKIFRNCLCYINGFSALKEGNKGTQKVPVVFTVKDIIMGIAGLEKGSHFCGIGQKVLPGFIGLLRPHVIITKNVIVCS